ncbi:MAG: ion transporter [Bryobacterales bacterium]
MSVSSPRPAIGLRERLHEIIFEADTPGGRAFDVALLWCILLSILSVALESVASIRQAYGWQLRAAEWTFTGLFTIEYVLRLYSVRKPLAYARSFFGIVDLLATMPAYLSLVIAGSQSLLVIRALRLLRIFRILKLTHYVREAGVLSQAMRASRIKITVFLGVVGTIACIMGTLMYLVEGEANGFSSIPVSIYWAIVTMTTVGYGDIAPKTVTGQLLATLLMLLGYAIIAVPTGIVSVELAQVQRPIDTRACPGCGAGKHDTDATFCKYCGAQL